MKPYINEVLNSKALIIGMGESVKVSDGKFVHIVGGDVKDTGVVDLSGYSREKSGDAKVDYAKATLFFGDFLYTAISCEGIYSLWKTDRNELIDLFSQLMCDWEFIQTAPKHWFESYMAVSESADIQENSNSIGVVIDADSRNRAIVQITDYALYVFTHKSDFDAKRMCKMMSMAFSWASEKTPEVFGANEDSICKYREQVVIGALAACGIRLLKDAPLQVLDTNVHPFEYRRTEDTDVYAKIGDIYQFNTYTFMV